MASEPYFRYTFLPWCQALSGIRPRMRKTNGSMVWALSKPSERSWTHGVSLLEICGTAGLSNAFTVSDSLAMESQLCDSHIAVG
jgi:hypothetical protein